MYCKVPNSKESSAVSARSLSHDVREVIDAHPEANESPRLQFVLDQSRSTADEKAGSVSSG
jgi:hypothetical protein